MRIFFLTIVALCFCTASLRIESTFARSAKFLNKKLMPVKKVYLYAPLWGDVFEQQSDLAPANSVAMSRDGCRDHIFLLKEELQKRGITLRQIKHNQLRQLVTLAPDQRVIFFDLVAKPKEILAIVKRYDPEQCILVAWEPPTIAPLSYNKNLHGNFKTIFTMWDDLVDGDRYYKLYYPHALDLVLSSLSFEQKKLCAIIAGNKKWVLGGPFVNLYQKRRELIKFFEQFAPDQLDLYGSGWDAVLRVYKGAISNKRACLHNYKFSITYENTGNMAGYITEKIFDSMAAGTVPVYWGANNIAEYIPQHCFIDARDFATPNDLYSYLNSMQEHEYTQFCGAINKFLMSDQAQLFSYKNFVSTMLQALMVGEIE